ncbi:hypothetical protein OBBRIDRAFT_377496 [Obba rivulosa]|uniref:Uncharacterized protein n=1 Tax=Obba rivulosa TaxID=1052685 RepID=A0A8E2AHV6_9APHY|nr:hypothetical protein OBBRIDRAFT_377496 [Obba rivulosa]
MASQHFETWSPAGIKGEGDRIPGAFASVQRAGPSRRTGSGDQESNLFAYSGNFPQDQSYRRMAERGNMRPPSSDSTSSLSNAMGETHISPHARTSRTPPSGISPWAPTAASIQEGHYSLMQDEAVSMIPYPGLGPPTPITSANPSGAFVYQQYTTPNFNSSPESVSPVVGLSSGMPSPAYPGQGQFAMQQARAQAMQQGMHPINPAAGIPMVMSPAPGQLPPSLSRAPPTSEEQIQYLQRRVRDLELINHAARSRVEELEFELARGSPFSTHAPPGTGSLPSPLPTPLPAAPSFEEEWKARTNARVKLFCSLNRAGNALCAWHDSRRERRAHPPRMAPPGHLNCGCTYEEALFEESLARHGVGSYLPGESVRMDPALRNPLLKLLQQRYGYRDGDFERDPLTGEWVEGEGAAHWEGKFSAGSAHVRRRGDERRAT